MAEDNIVLALESTFQQVRAMAAPLNERLALVADRVRDLNPDFAQAVEALVGRLAATSAGGGAPMIGEPMPPFTLPDETGRLVSLTQLLESGPVAVSFNRGHWCPYCRLNTAALATAREAIAAVGANIVAITPERRKFASALKQDAAAPFSFLTDMDNGYALSLNLAIWVGTEMEVLLDGAGCNLPLYQGNAAWILPIPATFIIGTDGLIADRFVDPDYRRRMEIEDLVTALQRAGRAPRTAIPRLEAG
jgi:peroxiredoxin